MVIWLIGLSGAGKTTIGRRVFETWKSEAPNTVFVDGDDIRVLFRHDQRPDAHTLDGRRLNAEHITDLCAWLDSQGINVVCAILSLFPEMRRQNRNLFSGYFEVYLKVPMDELYRRDSKGLYAAAERGEMPNVVGKDIPFPEPDAADLVIENSGPGADPKTLANEILAKAMKAG